MCERVWDGCPLSGILRYPWLTGRYTISNDTGSRRDKDLPYIVIKRETSQSRDDVRQSFLCFLQETHIRVDILLFVCCVYNLFCVCVCVCVQSPNALKLFLCAFVTAGITWNACSLTSSTSSFHNREDSVLKQLRQWRHDPYPRRTASSKDRASSRALVPRLPVRPKQNLNGPLSSSPEERVASSDQQKGTRFHSPPDNKKSSSVNYYSSRLFVNYFPCCFHFR